MNGISGLRFSYHHKLNIQQGFNKHAVFQQESNSAVLFFYGNGIKWPRFFFLISILTSLLFRSN